MIDTRQELKRFLQEDAAANRMEGATFISYIVRLASGSESAHVYRYLKCLRHCEFHYNSTGLYHKVMSMYYRFRLHRMGLRYGIRIPLNVCGYGLTIYHIAGGGGCNLNAARVGNHCRIQAGVLLGNAHHSEDEKPVIGDDVEIGPGAKVLGKVTVGNGAVIGANAVVTHDVEPGVFAGGVPAHTIKSLY